MGESNRHINYTAADIEKYWKGQLSVAEQHAIEKAALEDPFLSDAIEGYEAKARAPESLIAADMSDLQKRLSERTTERKATPVIGFSWWKVAAILIILIGAGWLFTWMNAKENTNAVAKNTEVKKEIPVPATADTNTSVTADSADSFSDLAINKKTPAAEKIKPSFYTTEKNSRTRDSVAAGAGAMAAPVSAETEIARAEDKSADKKDEAEKPVPLKKETEKSVVATINQKARGIASDDFKNNSNEALAGRANNLSNTFNGKLLDQSNKPVANAFIQIPNLNVATQTNKKGDFSFMAQDTGLSVTIASDGFETQNIHLRNNAVLNQIVLTPVPDNLKEVVVQSNGAERKKQAPGKDVSIKILSAEPSIGWDAYNEYLEKNKKVNEDAKNIHGSVIVSFQVHTKLLNNFRVEQSVDEELDAEAIRLIREGPAWKLLKGKKANATVVVKF